MEGVVADKDREIIELKEQIEELSKAQSIIEGLNEELKGRDQDIAMLKAKLHLDLIDMQINLIPDQPDMMEELNALYT